MIKSLMDESIDKLFQALLDSETEEKLKKDQKKSDKISNELTKTPIEILLQDLMYRWLNSNDGLQVTTNTLKNALHVLLQDRTNPIVENLMQQEIKHAVSSIMTYYVNDDFIKTVIHEYINKKVSNQLEQTSNITDKLQDTLIEEKVNSIITNHVTSQISQIDIKDITESTIKSIINKKFNSI